MPGTTRASDSSAEPDTRAEPALLDRLAAVVRPLCDADAPDALERSMRAVVELPGIVGVELEHAGGLVSAGVPGGTPESFPLGVAGSSGRLVVRRDPAYEDVTGRALEVLVPVLAGVLRQRATTSALAEREAASRAAVDTALDGIVTLGADGVIREFNPAAERIFGHRRDDVVGRPLADVLVPERLRGAHRVGMERYLRTGRSTMLGRRVEMPALHADGREMTVELAISPSTRGGDPFFTGFVRDVTEARDMRRRLEETTSRLRTLIASLHAAVLLEDEQRRIVVTNEAFTGMFGIPAPPAALLGADCSQAAEESKHLFEDPEGFVASVDQCLAERRLVTGTELATADGRTLERDYVPVFRDGDYLGHLWLYRDITARKEAERRLAQQNRMLADLARMKDRFVATVSHELRTPLTAVIGFTEILGRPESGPLTEDQRSYLEVIERNARQLVALGNDLLTLMSAESEGVRLDVGELDAAELVTHAVSDHRSRADERGVTLEAVTPDRLPVEGDAARLRQVLDNLVGNAVKYTPRGGRVTVVVSADDDSWRVEVRDTGIGIPRAEQDRLFTSFFRASNTRSGVTPGTGLGLVITRAIVELHCGTITVASEEGAGTTVEVTLPRHRPGGGEPR